MGDFITMSCTSDGRKLQFTNDIIRFTCANCRNEHLLKRLGGKLFLISMIVALHHILEGTDKTASELALARIQNVIN